MFRYDLITIGYQGAPRRLQQLRYLCEIVNRGLHAVDANHLFEASNCFVMTLEGRHLEDYLRDFTALVKVVLHGR